MSQLQPIARWTWIPGLVYSGLVRIELLADHLTGIRQVNWCVNGSYVLSTVADHRHTVWADGDFLGNGVHQISATVVPNDGTPRVLTASLAIGDVAPIKLDARTYTIADLMALARDAKDFCLIDGCSQATLDLTNPLQRQWPVYQTLVLRNLQVRGGKFLRPKAAAGVTTPARLIAQNVLVDALGVRDNGKPMDAPWLGWESWSENVTVKGTINGLGGSELAQRCTFDGLYSDPLQGPTCVDRCVAKNIDRGEFVALHPDVAQFHQNADNRIIYGLVAVDNIKAMGIGGKPGSLSNIAVLDCQINNGGAGMTAMGWGGAIDHLVMRRCRFDGGGSLMFCDSNLQITNSLMEGCSFRGLQSPTWFRGVAQPGLVIR